MRFHVNLESCSGRAGEISGRRCDGSPHVSEEVKPATWPQYMLGPTGA